MKNVLLCIGMLLPCIGFSQIIHVPAQQPTIQAGINAASNGDTVLIAEGTYYENIRFHGKAITIGSNFILDGDTSHVGNTIIDGSQPVNSDTAAVVMFIDGEDTTSILAGLTITGGSGVKTEDPELLYTMKCGGGIYVDNSGAKIIHNRIINNSVSGDTVTGGGIGTLYRGQDTWVVIRGNTIAFNNLSGNEDYSYGGGISSTTFVIIEDNEIAHNTVTNLTANSVGGGIDLFRYSSSSATALVDNNLIHHNICSGYHYGEGGGISTLNINAMILNNHIYDNSVSTASYRAFGGGILIWSYTPGSNQSKIFGNEIYGNEVSGVRTWAGGIYCQDIDVIIKDNHIYQNRLDPTIGAYGAGIWLSEPNSAIVEGNEITDNKAPWGLTYCYGGGMGLWGVNERTAVIDRNLFRGNHSEMGGGCYIRKAYNLRLTNNIFVNDSAQQGGALYLYNYEENKDQGNPLKTTEPFVLNNTFYANYAYWYGTALMILGDSYSPRIVNCIFWENRGGGVEIHNGSLDTLSLEYNDIDTSAIFGDFEFQGNIHADPLFVDAVNGNYELAWGSPCIDAGSPDPAAAQIPVTAYDFLMAPRLWDGNNDNDTIVDMGACEYLFYQGIPENPSRGHQLFASLYPNPFTHTLNIEVEVSEPGEYSILIMDQLGRLVHREAMEFAAGQNIYSWDAHTTPAGIFFITISSEQERWTGKAVLSR